MEDTEGAQSEYDTDNNKPANRFQVQRVRQTSVTIVSPEDEKANSNLKSNGDINDDHNNDAASTPTSTLTKQPPLSQPVDNGDVGEIKVDVDDSSSDDSTQEKKDSSSSEQEQRKEEPGDLAKDKLLLSNKDGDAADRLEQNNKTKSKENLPSAATEKEQDNFLDSSSANKGDADNPEEKRKSNNGGYD